MNATDPDREFFVDLVASAFPSFAPTIYNGTDDAEYEYVCQDSSAEGLACPENCTSLEECDACECEIAYLEDTGGPWGPVMDVLFCLLPIIYLIVATVKPNPTPTTKSLPFSAFIMFLVRLMYLGSNPLLTSGCVILGIHEALTPLTIMAGAITLFETMEATKCLPYMMREMKALTAGHPVAEVMLLFGFATLVEGASGFGTPVALGAPMLVSTGHPPLESVVILLLFNTFATVWGAVGTPLWFGFGELGLSEDDYLEISYRASTAMCFSAFILIPFIMTILVPLRIVRKNIIFLLLSIACVMAPLLGLSFVNYEFPSLLGGLIGMCLTAVLIKFKVGLADHTVEDEEEEEKLEDPTEGCCRWPWRKKDASDADGQEAAAESIPSIPVQVSDLMEISTMTRGYHRNISDLTEAKTPTNQSATAQSSVKPATVEEDPEAPTVPNNSSTDTTADEAPAVPNADEETGSQNNEEHEATTNTLGDGHWDNVEVQQDGQSTDEASRTVVFVSDTTKEEAEKVPEPPLVEEAKEEAENSLEPPLVEEAQMHGSQPQKSNQLTRSQIMAASSTNREDALLGPRKSWSEGYLREMFMRTFPIWGVVVILILTRVESIGIKEYLTMQEPYWEVVFGTYGDFRLSVSVVFMLKNILTYPGLDWKYELFYIPFIIPFVFVSGLTMIWYRKDLTSSPKDVARTVVGRLKNPAVALVGALILVQLMIKSGAEAPAYLLGTILADWFKQGFVVICPILGALGSFFSGSTTVSNLTFGAIQKLAAEQIGVSVNTMLALQAFGASAGNGICLNNIISALAVVGLDVSEGQILKRTVKYVFSSTTIATAVMLAFWFRFN